MSSHKTLVTYEQKSGATEESTRKIADILCSKFQLEVDLVNLRAQNISERQAFGGRMSTFGKKIFDAVDLNKAKVWS
jgi:hypothetical protein